MCSLPLVIKTSTIMNTAVDSEVQGQRTEDTIVSRTTVLFFFCVIFSITFSERGKCSDCPGALP
jgi:hypothetical protein